jgi:diguanylate cyclase (GGDEF)-like protein/PAS domain S-box-containing protein
MEFFARRIWQPDLALTNAARSVGRQIGQFMERKRAEEHYRELVELSPNAILVHCEGRIVFANSATARLLGATHPAELNGRSIYDFVHADHREFARSRVALIIEQRRALGTSEMKSVGLDGIVRDMEVSSSYFVFEGRPAVQAIARDISERKAAEQKIFRLSKLYAALSQTNQAITCLTDAQALFEQICQIAVEQERVRPGRNCHDRLADPLGAGGRRGWSATRLHPPRASVGRSRFARGAGLVGTALRSGQHVICNDVMQDERTLPFREALGATKLSAVAIMPLFRSGTVVGGLILCAAEAGYFDTQLIELLVEMASNISFALDTIDKETHRREAEECFAQLAQYDVLTGLPNRNLFRDRLLQAIARARRVGGLVGLMFFDLDRFKQINDTLGHGTGDRVLQVVAGRLKEHLREVDTISRLGGDEFTLILEGAADGARLAMVAQKVHETLAAPIRIDGREIFVSTSIGITVYPRDATDVDDLVRNADLAVYRAKREGRNAYVFHTPEMSARAAHRLYIEEGLHRALEQKELVLHYQPTLKPRLGVSWAWKRCCWNSPGGLVGPLERSGGGRNRAHRRHWPLGAGVRLHSGGAVATAGVGAAVLRINVSARQFMERDLFPSITTSLSRSGFPASLLALEITESMLIDQTSDMSEVLAKLVQLGVRLAIDDFGTGYSSLTYLKRFSLHDIKIDQSFVREITSDPDDAAIVRAIIAMARSLDIGVIAEGVETQAQLQLLQNLGCDAYQGYLFSPPLPCDAFESLLSLQPR